MMYHTRQILTVSALFAQYSNVQDLIIYRVPLDTVQILQYLCITRTAFSRTQYRLIPLSFIIFIVP